MSPAVEIAGLRKRYSSIFRPNTMALDGLDMVVEKGQVHGFLGPNGSGKTTTLRILLGLARANGGYMRILGHEVPRELPQVIQRVGSVVESPQFFKHFSGHKTLSLLAKTAGIPNSRVLEVLAQVGLHDRAKQKVKAYSLGMRQRLAVASALLKQPELLILDEPANGMDPAGIREMRELMQSLAAQGMTVLVSSHLLSEVQQLCDTMTIVSRGRRVTSGGVDEVIGRHGVGELRVRVGDDEQLSAAAQALETEDVTVTPATDHLMVSGVSDPAWVTKTLADEEIYVSELVRNAPDLETVFLQLTGTAPVDGRYPQVDDAVLPALPTQATAPAAETVTVTADSEESAK
ncbi:ABC transporter ATP-binding protein [Stackebrandtia nassauensis]|uniref:ABC transporter related protein n=1 Tax=Stackebrandtia nassauensis (strain DSM 44728 / CIP 108903 / NRRL B-16338 / NBRC 102104 / LLR-40K-21) TaxID=446470 RepID=D3Q9X5_STANL|nr:ATP-binding cassette domain-containing protein [Stackebrandtia nassauensis]ADD44671.1 ABC transporter related protein [Stackebrandtia nassauensis DSM 44728]